jgi:hypothetical protein
MGHTSMFSPIPPFGVWLRRTVQGVVALLLTTMAMGNLYQMVSLIRERRAHPMPGQLVDVDGYKLHIYCIGDGSPTVILDSGLGDSLRGRAKRILPLVQRVLLTWSALPSVLPLTYRGSQDGRRIRIPHPKEGGCTLR